MFKAKPIALGKNMFLRAIIIMCNKFLLRNERVTHTKKKRFKFPNKKKAIIGQFILLV